MASFFKYRLAIFRLVKMSESTNFLALVVNFARVKVGPGKA